MQAIVSEILNVVINKTISSPLNVIKVRMQCMDQLVRLGRIQVPYKGIWDCLTRIIKEEGLLALWKGNSTNIMIGVLTLAVNLFIALYVKKLFAKMPSNSGLSKFISSIISGATVGTISMACLYPFTTAYNNKVNDVNNVFQGPFQIQKRIIQKQGIKGLYGGFHLSIVGIILYRASYFGLYDFFKQFVQESSIFKKFFISIGVTILAGLITYPFDLVRQRMMTAAGTQLKYLDSKQCVQTVMKDNGVKGFWTGAGTNIVKTLGTTFSIVIFDIVKNSFLEK